MNSCSRTFEFACLLTELYFLGSFTRHGARTAIQNTLPNDSTQTSGLGGLATLGKQQCSSHLRHMSRLKHWSQCALIQHGFVGHTPCHMLGWYSRLLGSQSAPRIHNGDKLYPQKLGCNPTRGL